MTHDELLERIVRLPILHEDVLNARKALRAVVELHKPVMSRFNADEVYKEQCMECITEPYPCPTIQAITEQLK